MSNGQVAPDFPGQPLQLTNLLQLLRLRWLFIVGMALLTLIIVTPIILSLAPRYSAAAIVTFDQRINSVTDADAVLSKLSGNSATVQAQLQTLRSRSFLSRVIAKERLENDPAYNTRLQNDDAEGDFLTTWSARAESWLSSVAAWFSTIASTTDPDTVEQDVREEIAADLLSQEVNLAEVSDQDSAQDAPDAIIDGLLRALTVSQVGGAPAIRIEFRSTVPQQTARIANAIADTYIEDLLNTKFEATETASRFLSDRVTELRGQLQAADTAAAQYRLNNSSVETGQAPSTMDQQLGALSAELVAARMSLAEQVAKAGRIRDLQQEGRSVEVTQVADSPLIAQLRAEQNTLQRQEAELSSRYGPRHPRMVDLESQKQDLQRKIAEEVGRITRTASNEIQMAQAKVTSLEQSMNVLEKAVVGRNQSLVTLKQLEERAASTRTLYEAALLRFEQVKDREQIQRPDARVLSYAAVPRQRDFPPSRALMLAVMVPASLFLGFFALVLREFLANGFRTSAHVEQILALPVLAMAPEMRGKKTRSIINIVNDKPCSSYAESIRGIQLGLCLPDVDRSPKVILVTSSMPREGKSTVAMSLARSAARNGKKVVLVDCDLRRPSVLTMARSGKVSKGLVQALLGKESLENCLQKDPRSEVLLLGPETIVENPARLLGSIEMENLIRELRASADLVIIDSAPLLPVNDTKLLVRLVDTMLLIVRWEKTPRNAAAAAARSLFDLHAPIAGVVMTRADPRQYYAYSYGLSHYSSYAQYYRD